MKKKFSLVKKNAVEKKILHVFFLYVASLNKIFWKYILYYPKCIPFDQHRTLSMPISEGQMQFDC